MPTEQPNRDAEMTVLTTLQLETERRLVAASQKDPLRFAALYEHYFNRVYAFALTRTGDRAAAEDVTSETFHQALRNLARFEWRGVPFSAWLFRIAANAAAKHVRRANRDLALGEIADVPEESWEARFIEVEERTRLFELVARLPWDQRQVVTMRFSAEKNTGEIADALGRSEGAVKQLQFRALRNLRRWVGEYSE